MKIDATKKPGVLRIVSLGDIHLNHPNTPTGHIIRNLDQYCTNDQVLREVDLLIITGDVFETLASNAGNDVYLIHRWITRLLYRCAALDVVIRIVEGTPSHDWEQSQFFIEQAENAKIPVDIHYAKKLSIEFLERFGIHILYVPDKLDGGPGQVLEDVHVLLKQHEIEQVDFAIMHGAFKYQLPAMVHHICHDADAYLALVRHLIFIGHIHVPSQYERILAAGSFDRMKHDEEHPKGFYDVTIKEDGAWTATFMENKGAKVYATLDCRGLDTKAANVVIRKATQQYPKGSALRIKCLPNDAVLGDLEGIKRTYREFQWTTPAVEKQKKEDKESFDEVMAMDLDQMVPITDTTIMDLAETELERHAADSATQQRCRQRLQELLTAED